VKYAEGVMVFTMQKGGLMYEASVGGQQFKFTKLRRFCYGSHKLYNVALVAFEKRETPDKTRV
jgi:hypothetical protein